MGTEVKTTTSVLAPVNTFSSAIKIQKKGKASAQNHKCATCGKCFNYRNHLKSHSVVHSELRPFCCLVCGMTFKLEQVFRNHSLLHSDRYKEWLRCIFCAKGFSTAANFQRHMRSHTLEKPYFCNLCPGEFGDYGTLKGHIARRHDPERERVIECDICERRFFTPLELKLHLVMHSQELPFRCDICRKGFKRKRELHFHQVTHETAKPFVCNICNRSFKHPSNLYSHSAVHTGKNRNKFGCDKCPRKFTAKESLRRHEDTFHENKIFKNFECELCQRRFYTQADLRRHFAVHLGPKPFPCDLCHLKFKTSAELKSHKSTSADLNGHSWIKFEHHREDAGSRGAARCCVFCSKSFTKQPQLNRHIIRHIKERPFSCTLCPFESAHLISLRLHLATHNPNRRKDFKCPECEKVFYTPAEVKIHRKRHAPVKALECGVCMKRFYTRSGLNAHEKIHNRNRVLPPPCNICGKQLTSKCGLLAHIRSHTGEAQNLFGCEQCLKKFKSLSNLTQHVKAVHAADRPRKEFECENCKKWFRTSENLQKHLRVHEPPGPDGESDSDSDSPFFRKVWYEGSLVWGNREG